MSSKSWDVNNEPAATGCETTQYAELRSESAANANEERRAAKKSTPATITRGDFKEIDVFDCCDMGQSKRYFLTCGVALSTVNL